MKIRSSWLMYLMVFSLLLGLWGCGGSKQTAPGDSGQHPDIWYQKTAEDTPLPGDYQNLVLSFSTTPDVQRDYPGALKECEMVAINRLYSKGSFDAVEKGEPGATYQEGTLLIKVFIPEMRIVGTSARIWLGGWMGDSYMNLDVQMIDAAKDEVLRTKKLSSKTNAYAATWTFGATDRSLDDDMGRMLADYIITVVH